MTKRVALAEYLSLLDPNKVSKFQAEIAQIAMTAISQRFHDYSYHRGDWKDITPQRKRYKAKHYPGTENRINVASKELERALVPGKVTNKTYIAPPNQTVRITPRRISIQINLPYVDYVHKARPLIDTPTRREIARQVAVHLTETLRSL